MGVVKKNKIHNPQIITDVVPQTVGPEDIGRLWVDAPSNSIKIAVNNKETGQPELRDLLDTTNLEAIDGEFFKGIREEVQTVSLQVSGDKHFDNGYDFFSDEVYLANSTQNDDDFYSFFYVEVPDTNANNYLRTISTASGTKHIRMANGLDTYSYESTDHKIVRYTKITLDNEAKEIVDIKFPNKDSLILGYELAEDNKTILIYSDPDGFFNNKKVIVKYLI